MKNTPRRRPSSTGGKRADSRRDDGKPVRPRTPREFGEERAARPDARRDERPTRSRRDDGDRPTRSYGDRDDRPTRAPRRDDDRPTRSYGNREDRPTRSYGDRDDRPARAPRRDDGDRPTRSYGNRDDRPTRSYGDRDDRPARAPRRDDGDRPTRSYGNREDRPTRAPRRDDGDRPTRSYGNRDDRPTRAPRRDDGDRPTRSYGDRDDRPTRAPRRDDGDRPTRSYGDRDDRPTRAPRRDDGDRPTRSYGDRDDRPARAPRRDDGDRPTRSYGNREDRPARAPRRDDGDRPKRSYGGERSERPARSKWDEMDRPARGRKDDSEGGEFRSSRSKREFGDQPDARPFASVKRGGSKKKNSPDLPSQDGAIRLNRYISMAGICSRREADDMIKAGLFSVNGEIVTEMGTKVFPGDDIRYNGERIRNEKLVYVLLNKPKDYITTMDDPDKRKTVMELVHGAGRERIYPVGRLDRNTTGLLLLTNDGDLAKTLTHPSSRVRKLYSVELDKALKVSDMRKLVDGIEIDELGMMQVDDIAFDKDGTDKRVVGVEIHSGQNRVVRRMFEQLGYEVTKLDRTIFAGLTKKDLPRGRWRYLSEQEVAMLKMISGGPKRK